jgi:hypothetical protein
MLHSSGLKRDFTQKKKGKIFLSLAFNLKKLYESSPYGPDTDCQIVQGKPVNRELLIYVSCDTI